MIEKFTNTAHNMKTIKNNLVGSTVEWTNNETLVRKGNKALIVLKPKMLRNEKKEKIN